MSSFSIYLYKNKTKSERFNNFRIQNNQKYCYNDKAVKAIPKNVKAC